MTEWPGMLRGSAAFHALAGACTVVWPERWPWFAGALVANHSVLVAAGLLPRSRLLGPNLTRLPEEMAQRKEVGLTFDDGPEPRTTPEVLRILESRGARASFFCVGSRVTAYRDVAAAIADGGHRLENHSYRHSPAFFFHSPGALRNELLRCNEAVELASGRAPVWFRAPAGFRSPLLQPVLGGLGLGLASWTRRGFDAVERDPGKVAERLTGNLRAGDILLLHDGPCARTASGKPVVLEALPRVLDGIASSGLRAVPLPGKSLA